MYVLIYSCLQRGFLHLQTPATISACHADRTECDRLSFSDQMMRHNRLSGHSESRLLSSSGLTVFNDLFTAFNALSQWTSLMTYGIRRRPTGGFHWRIVVKLGAPA